MGSIVDALVSVKKNSVMQDTWGHLYPAPGSKHTGHILLACGDYGGTTILDYDFGELCGSPQVAELVAQSMDLYELSQGVFKIECTLWFFKNSNDMYRTRDSIGKIIKPKLITLLDLSD